MKGTITCTICGDNHTTANCDMVQIKSQIKDKPVPPRAKLSLPEELKIHTFSDLTHSVTALGLLEAGTKFGPFQAPKTCTLYPNIVFPLKVFSEKEEDLKESFLDTTDENRCNWMMYVSAATNLSEQNLICYQEEDEIFYIAIRDINPGEHLRVWYSPYYAIRMNKETLNRPARENAIPQTIATTLDDLVAKKNVVTRDIWCCKFCGKSENRITKFAAHLLNHYKFKMRNACEICKSFFDSREELQKHIKTVHATTSTNSNQNLSKFKKTTKPDLTINNTTTLDSKKDLQKRINTALIPISSNPNQNLTKYKKTTKPSILTINDSTTVGGPLLLQSNPDHSGLSMLETELEVEPFEVDFADSALVDFDFNLKDSENEQLVCDICLKSFKKLRLLAMHLQQHTGRYYCSDCDKVFTRKENFNYHVCVAPYKFKCSICEKLFMQSKSLTHHIRYFHEKKFYCNECKILFRCQKELDTHSCTKKYTLKKRIYPCNECKGKFSNKYNLKIHIRNVHKEESEDLTCLVCHKKFKHWDSLKKHEKLHENDLNHKLECKVCNRTFTRLDVLKDHINAIHKPTPQNCHVCGKTFNTKQLLRRHFITHSNVKPHSCRFCSKSFKVKCNLLRHMRICSNSVKLNDSSTKLYSCPLCDTKMKIKSSLPRHIKRKHPDKKQQFDELEMELKKTMEKVCLEPKNDINIEIDKLLNEKGDVDTFVGDSNDRLMESLLEIAHNSGNASGGLSMPDLELK